jgi:hypothetical protein
LYPKVRGRGSFVKKKEGKKRRTKKRKKEREKSL